MARFPQLHIYHLVRQVLRELLVITKPNQAFGDLHSQICSAAISIASNIYEGSSSGSDAQFLHYLKIARSSCSEVQGQ